MPPETYVDEQGRRRIDRGDGKAESARDRGKDPAITALEAKLAAAEAKIAAFTPRIESIEGAEICGPGFSGELKEGISYDPTATGTGTGGGGGGTKRVIIVDNGTANYYDIKATFVGAV